MRSQKQTEFLMVKHFLAKNALNSQDALAVYEQLVTNKQFRSSMMMFLFIFMFGITTIFGFFVLGYPPLSTEIGGNVLCLILALFLTFTIRSVFKHFKIVKLQKENGHVVHAVEALREAIFSFYCQFNERPEKLGPKGVAIRLTSVAKKIFEYKEEHDELGAEMERERLRILYDTAQVLLPVNAYPAIFDAAENGKEAPEWIVDFAK